MFELKDLKKLKDLVRSELESELRITKAIYNGIGGTDIELYPYEYMLKMQFKSVEYDQGVIEPSDLDKLSELTTSIKAIDSKLKVRGSTRPTYSGSRYDEFKAVKFTLVYYVPIDEVDEQVVKAKTKARLTKRVMPKGYNEYTFSLDCKLLDQFKLGTLTMQQVVDGSIGNCEI